MLYKLENIQYSIQIDTLGAELKSLLFQGEEYLHQGDDIYWHRSSPILFPIVGRLKNNNLKYKNKNYRLPIHGFARFHNFELSKQTQNILEFKLTENEETLKQYPFEFELYLTYILSNEGLQINYRVTSPDKILFSLGAHPAFLLKTDIKDSFFEFEKSETQNALALNLKYGCICDEKRYTLDSKILKLEENIFLEDALIFKNTNSKEVCFKNSVNSKSIKMNYKGFEYIAFWAPVGAPFVCMEPWCGIADNLKTNHEFNEKTSLIKLEKGEIFDKTVVISLT